jgi:acylphosphatase
MRRVNVIVHGVVQGVGFRYAMREAAEREGVTGWVRNRSDGSVEAELQGDPAAVDAVLAWAAEGPPGSRVGGSQVTDSPPTDGETGFEVRATV